MGVAVPGGEGGRGPGPGDWLPGEGAVAGCRLRGPRVGGPGPVRARLPPGPGRAVGLGVLEAGGGCFVVRRGAGREALSRGRRMVGGRQGACPGRRWSPGCVTRVGPGRSVCGPRLRRAALSGRGAGAGPVFRGAGQGPGGRRSQGAVAWPGGARPGWLRSTEWVTGWGRVGARPVLGWVGSGWFRVSAPGCVRPRCRSRGCCVGGYFFGVRSSRDSTRAATWRRSSDESFWRLAIRRSTSGSAGRAAVPSGP